MPAQRNSNNGRGRGNANRGSGSGSSRARGSNRGRGGNRGGRGGRGGGSSYVPYSAPTFPASRTLSFYNKSSWDESKLDAAGVEKIYFGADFDVTDAHLAAISSRPALAASLKSLSLGDSDTGNGFHLTDAAVIALANACSNIRVLSLDATTKITDAALFACCQACPVLESLRITGNDKVKGQIHGASLEQLKDSPTVAPNLQQLSLYDQPGGAKFTKALKALSKKRKQLIIQEGETLGDGIGDQMIAAMSGGNMLGTWQGGKLVGIDNDMGVFGPGGYSLYDTGFF
ncbi:hypothetical protein C8J56DRAFT_349838 [Mycena floridula]|nr:hypothetical protein C8J56DRAFT_583021 [Mycena floridula]KAJ7578491.1 hypothetical protein C8J56DRAFT_349838 [Mycena floridula]